MPKMYWCTECNKKHKSGKIYKEHMKYKYIEKPEYDNKKIQKIDFKLSEIAENQIISHINKMLWHPLRRDFYISKINELIEYERRKSRKGRGLFNR